MGNFIDLKGNKYGRLIVIDRFASNSSCLKWLCRCECGKEKIVRGSDLKNGHTKSCGCLHKEIVANILSETCNANAHGKSRTRLYNIWNSMRSRCYNSKNSSFKYYGGRDITICDEWREDFQCFENWALQNGYADNLSIDRIDVEGNYEPSNCRWATPKEQANNKRNKKGSGV